MNLPVFMTDVEFRSFRDENASVELIDQFHQQAEQLFSIRNPQEFLKHKNAHTKPETADFISQLRDEYVYFPWEHLTYRILAREDYYELKTSRNRPLISLEEQNILKDFRVAVIGLSVGSNVAHALSLMGCSYNMMLCDLDTLELSNFNRLMGGLQNVGQNKAELVAKNMLFNDPFCMPEVVSSPVTTEMLEQSHQNKPLRLIVEEIDSLPEKVSIRKWAKKNGVPVLMLTSDVDNLIVDIERYDLDPSLEYLDRSEAEWQELLQSHDGTVQSAVRIIKQIIGENYIDPYMITAAEKVGSEVVTWPQLVTPGYLAGSTGAAAIKRIALGQDQRSRVKHKITTDE